MRGTRFLFCLIGIFSITLGGCGETPAQKASALSNKMYANSTTEQTGQFSGTNTKSTHFSFTHIGENGGGMEGTITNTSNQTLDVDEMDVNALDSNEATIETFTSGFYWQNLPPGASASFITDGMNNKNPASYIITVRYYAEN